MRPALSVILLTTLIGAGQGLFIALYALDAGARLGFGADPGDAFLWTGSVLSLVLLGGGLLASFFHLGHPERAWRTVARWRTSWLSREVVVLPLVIALVAGYGLVHGAASGFGPSAAYGPLAAALGAGAAAASLALFVCTGMIYACIRFIEEWASPLTVVNFSLLGLASGFTVATALASLWPEPLPARALAVAALAATVAGAGGRLASMYRNGSLRHRTTLETAIGIRHRHIAQRARGFTGESFNTREFFHGATQRRLAAMRRAFVGLAFAAPAVLLVGALGLDAVWLAVPAALCQLPGLMLERWYFFAEARHPQNLYYQAVS